MTPRTKLQKRVAMLSSKIAPINEKQKEYAFEHCFNHIGRRIKAGITCLDCGYTYQDLALHENDEITFCPGCGRKLIIEDSKKRKFDAADYFCITTTCKEFQVLRFFEARCYRKVGEKAKYRICEIIQRWLLPDGRYETIAVLRSQSFGYYLDSWAWTSGMEIRKDHMTYEVNPACVYPIRRYIPELKRNGFKGDFHGVSPLRMFRLLLTDSIAETLLKAKQYKLLRHYESNSHKIQQLWPSIKICLRNNYTIRDATMWIDYIDLLQHFNKDIHNAKYICPVDLNTAHDKLSEKKRKLYEMERNERLKKQIASAEGKYQKMKKKFFGIEFSDGPIKVRTLQSVKEFVQEGDTLHHCVFTNQYYLRPDALILSARIDNKPIETIEVSLTTFKVIQVRGKFNQSSEYHDRIVELVNRNMNLIRKRAKKKVTNSNYQSL